MRTNKLTERALDELKEAPGRKTLGEFKSFLLRGNVVDLAIAVVIGAAFSDVVKSLVTNILTPLIAIPTGKVNFGDLAFSIGSTKFYYGNFLNSLISFVLISAAVFFLVVKPDSRLMNLRRTPKIEKTTRSCPECLSSIPTEARRCAFCTAVLTNG